VKADFTNVSMNNRFAFVVHDFISIKIKNKTA